MSRIYRIADDVRLGFPRSRGDEPDLLPNTAWPYAFSPLTRG